MQHDTKQARAAKGGEIGANGEFYEGGKFIAKTDKPKAAPKPFHKPGRKLEIEAFVWVKSEDAPEGYFTIWGMLGGVHFWNRESKTFTINLGLYENQEPVSAAACRAQDEALIAAFNEGKRWRRMPTSGQGWRAEFETLAAFI